MKGVGKESELIHISVAPKLGIACSLPRRRMSLSCKLATRRPVVLITIYIN